MLDTALLSQTFSKDTFRLLTVENARFADSVDNCTPGTKKESTFPHFLKNCGFYKFLGHF